MQVHDHTFVSEDEPRTKEEIREAEEALIRQLWYVTRYLQLDELGDHPFTPDQLERMEAAAERLLNAEQVREPEWDCEVAFWHGKLSALRWVMGSEWDFMEL